MAKVLRYVSRNNNCGVKKRKTGIKQVDAVILLLQPTKISVLFQCKWEISKRAQLRENFIETFSDVALHPEEYLFLATLEICNTINKHSSQKCLAGIEADNIEATLPSLNFAGDNCASELEASLLIDGIQTSDCEAMGWDIT